MRPDPIFLLGPHKSGTSLLRSLFDGADGHYTIPIETHHFQHLNYWIRYTYRRQFPGVCHKDQFINATVKWIKESNKNRDPYSDNTTIGWFDEQIFKEHITPKIRKADHPKDFINAYFESIYASLHDGQELDENVRFIEKSVESAEFAIDLAKFYPNAKFIHIIRNPYSNLSSLRRYKGQVRYPYLDILAKTLFDSYYFLYRNEKLLEKYMVVRYEDLVLDTEGTVKDLCRYLDISFQKQLMTPTAHGKIWEGNSVSDKDFKGVSDKRLNNWEEEINDIEIEVVNKLFTHILQRFDYEYKSSNTKFFLRRNKKEGVLRYLLNRVFLMRAETAM